MQEQTYQDSALEMVDEQTVERDGYDQFWDAVEGATTHHDPTAQAIDALRSSWLVRDLTEDDFRIARAAIAAMPDTKALDAADRLAKAADSLLDYMRTIDDGDSATRNAIDTYRTARGTKP